MGTLFLAGDVMTGRGIDQILPHPGDPELFEDYITCAKDYVYLAERTNGKITAPVNFPYIWGDALRELDLRKPYPRIVNLETAITDSKIREDKGINYKMHPGNVPALTAARVDCCVLANNHVLDWGRAGLHDTLVALEAANIKSAGAGRDIEEASAPAVMEISARCRVLVFGFGMVNSGIFPSWEASEDSPGVRILHDLSAGTAENIASEILAKKRPGDIVILSIHWGPNWGYEISPRQQDFARRLIDSGACDILHGHSSHHPLAFEIYREKLILYGCGDFINDYEGIEGHERYRGDLSVMYLPRLNEACGGLVDLTLVLFRKRRFRLEYAPLSDASWFETVIGHQCREFDTQLILNSCGTLTAEPL